MVSADQWCQAVANSLWKNIWMQQVCISNSWVQIQCFVVFIGCVNQAEINEGFIAWDSLIVETWKMLSFSVKMLSLVLMLQCASVVGGKYS